VCHGKREALLKRTAVPEWRDDCLAEVMAHNSGLRFSSIIASACLTVGCPFGDPEGPGAQGKILLPNEVSLTGFKSLRIVGFPDAEASFDPKSTLAESEFGWSEERTLSDVEFPYSYQVGDVLGTTPHQHYRLVAWLSKNSEAKQLESGDRFCSVRFRISSCAQYGDFCGVTNGVNCSLSEVVP
jgi:hypothetical protein